MSLTKISKRPVRLFLEAYKSGNLHLLYPSEIPKVSPKWLMECLLVGILTPVVLEVTRLLVKPEPVFLLTTAQPCKWRSTLARMAAHSHNSPLGQAQPATCT